MIKMINGIWAIEWYSDGCKLDCHFLWLNRLVRRVRPTLSCKNWRLTGTNLSYIHTRRPTNPRSFPTNFYGLVGYDRVKNYALIEERIYPRSTPAVPALYPWCTHVKIPLFPTYTRPSGWPIPALYDQPPTYSWCNYAHYAQYRTNPQSDFHSRPKMNNSSKRNANSTLRVQYPKCAHGPFIVN